MQIASKAMTNTPRPTVTPTTSGKLSDDDVEEFGVVESLGVELKLTGGGGDNALKGGGGTDEECGGGGGEADDPVPELPPEGGGGELSLEELGGGGGDGGEESSDGGGGGDAGGGEELEGGGGGDESESGGGAAGVDEDGGGEFSEDDWGGDGGELEDSGGGAVTEVDAIWGRSQTSQNYHLDVRRRRWELHHSPATARSRSSWPLNNTKNHKASHADDVTTTLATTLMVVMERVCVPEER